LEKALGLQEKPPIDFDPRWLTVEGLRKSRGEFEDFIEPGSWTVFLARDPDTYAKTYKPTSDADRLLSMGIAMFQVDVLFQELRARWEPVEGRETRQPVLPDYPLVSRIPDIASDAIYEPGEVSSLLTELRRAHEVVKDPKSIRGLDNLIRIANWAEKLNLGIYFGGE